MKIVRHFHWLGDMIVMVTQCSRDVILWRVMRDAPARVIHC